MEEAFGGGGGMKPPEMTDGAWAFMLISWALLILLTGYCFAVMLRKGKKE